MKWIDAPIWIKIGRNIKDCRKWKKFTQKEVAHKAQIDLKRYKRMERAIVQDITHAETYRIALALNIDEENVIYH